MPRFHSNKLFDHCKASKMGFWIPVILPFGWLSACDVMIATKMSSKNLVALGYCWLTFEKTFDPRLCVIIVSSAWNKTLLGFNYKNMENAGIWKRNNYGPQNGHISIYLIGRVRGLKQLRLGGILRWFTLSSCQSRNFAKTIERCSYV